MRHLAAFSFAALVTAGCNTESPPVVQTDAAVAADAFAEPDACGRARPTDVELYGAPLAQCAPFVSYDDLIADPLAYDGQSFETEAVVRANCQVRGCWMELRSTEDTASRAITVRFLDYGFFVPLDSRGANIAMQGDFAILTYTPEEVAHLRAEGATFDELLPDGSARMFTFTAHGVEMWNRRGR